MFVHVTFCFDVYRSSQSSPTSSEPPSIAATSGYSGDSNIKSTVVSQRLSADPSNHQQVCGV